jgi:alkanesulfonate monooxygenase SsuD/methylene tetrahydromethanopterin reductase-like flavin-dependent oxidoreductase (luciferase family)
MVYDSRLANRRREIPVRLGLIAGQFGRDITINSDLILEAERLGFSSVWTAEAYLDGKKAEAMSAVPDQLVDEIALVGPRERIAERVEAWKDSPADSMLLGAGQPEALRTVAELVL